MGTYTSKAIQDQCKGFDIGTDTASRVSILYANHKYTDILHSSKSRGRGADDVGHDDVANLYYRSVAMPIGEFIGFAQSFQDAKISLERLNEIHEKQDEEIGITSKLRRLPEQHDIHIHHVSFSYSGADRDYALNDVSLCIPAHKVTAIVGASGSGKTTLVKLLQGFYEPNRGEICVGHTPLSSFNPHFWRSVTGSVMQESFIFSDSIAKNIAVSTDEVDMERLRHAAHVANVDDFVDSLPLGFSTKIGMEGNGVSAGQRQRILIARAVYKNPQFIFFLTKQPTHWMPIMKK